VDGEYEDIPGYCVSASIAEVIEKNYVLTPGRYVGLPDEEDDFVFEERFTELTTEIHNFFQEEEKLNAIILSNLKKIRINE
jgi:type I restriction enzyme M protein